MRVLSLVLALFTFGAHAKRILEARALVPCMDGSGVTASKFNVTFDPASRQLSFDVSVNVDVSGYVSADITLYAYGFSAIKRTVNPCSSSTNIKQLCPLTSGEIDIQSNTVVDKSVISDIPGVAFTVPDIDAFAIVKVYRLNQDGTVDRTRELACIRAELSNTKTVAQTAVKWVTAVIAGIGLVVAGLFSYFGSPWTSQHIAASATLMINYFQAQALVNTEAVQRVPPIANSWSENVSWSIGLVYAKFLAKIFRWYVQSTGGTPDTYKIYPTISIITQRIRRRFVDLLDAAGPVGTAVGTAVAAPAARGPASQVPPRVADMLAFASRSGEDFDLRGALGVGARALARRDNELAKETYVQSSSLLLVFRGIKRVGWDMGIEDTSIVLTAFTLFVFVCVCAFFIFGVLALAFLPLRRSQSLHAHRHASQFVPVLGHILKGNILRLVFIGFPPITLFALWEFLQRDSAAVITTAVVMLLLEVAVVTIVTLKVLRQARESYLQHGTSAYLLYSDAPFRHRYGFAYAIYDAGKLWFLPLALAYNFVKVLFLAFAQSQGKVQGLAIFIIEVVMLVLVSWKKPYLDRSTNIIQIITQVVITLNALFYCFFSNIFTQPLAVNSVMGVIYFVLNAAFSLILLLYTIIYGLISVFRKTPDAHLEPAKDDRLSFIEEKGTIAPDAAGELTALGAAAQADHEHHGEHPEWFETENNSGTFDLPVPPKRDSRVLSSRANTMMSTSNSIPSFDALAHSDSGLPGHGGHRATDSQVSFGLHNADADDSDPYNPTPSSKKAGGIKKFWKR